MKDKKLRKALGFRTDPRTVSFPKEGEINFLKADISRVFEMMAERTNCLAKKLGYEFYHQPQQTNLLRKVNNGKKA